jgi:hypothetical protein
MTLELRFYGFAEGSWGRARRPGTSHLAVPSDFATRLHAPLRDIDAAGLHVPIWYARSHACKASRTSSRLCPVASSLG